MAATNRPQDALPKIVDDALKLIFRIGQWLCALLFCQERPPVCSLWIVPTTSLFNYCTYESGNHWRSVDAHFQDGAGSLIQIFLIWKAANTSFMNGYNQSALRLPKMHCQKLLMFRWSSFSEGGSDRVVYSFAKQNHQYAHYGYFWPRHHSITVLTRLKIVDAPLMLIVMYGEVKICCH